MVRCLIFDSGVGGLSVVAAIRTQLPDMQLCYVADDAGRPYGDKSETVLKARLPDLLAFLCGRLEIDICVIACNTASTTALADIRMALSVPVIGVVPAIKPAALQSRTRTIGVLGTPGTVQRQYVDGLIRDYAMDCRVILCGSLDMVAMSEARLLGQAVDMNRLAAEIAPLFTVPVSQSPDVVVLACTHFPLLKPELQSLKPDIVWLDSATAIARRLHTLSTDIDRPCNLQADADRAYSIGGDCSMVREQSFATYGFESLTDLIYERA